MRSAGKSFISGLLVAYSLIAIAFAGCETTAPPPRANTEATPAGTPLRGQFKESLIADNTYLISLRGNGFMPREAAYRYTLLHTGRFLEGKGYRYFELVDLTGQARARAQRLRFEQLIQPTIFDMPRERPNTSELGGGSVAIPYDPEQPYVLFQIVGHIKPPEESDFFFDVTFLQERSALAHRFGLAD